MSAKAQDSTSKQPKQADPEVTNGVVEIKANMIEENTGSPKQQNIFLLLPIKGKKQTDSCPTVFGYLNEFDEGKESRYPFYGEQSKKDGRIILDFGYGLSDDSTPEGRSEKLTTPAGYRYYTLRFTDDISTGKLFTITGGVDERDVYKISSVTEYQ